MKNYSFLNLAQITLNLLTLGGIYSCQLQDTHFRMGKDTIDGSRIIGTAKLGHNRESTATGTTPSSRDKAQSFTNECIMYLITNELDNSAIKNQFHVNINLLSELGIDFLELLKKLKYECHTILGSDDELTLTPKKLIDMCLQNCRLLSKLHFLYNLPSTSEYSIDSTKERRFEDICSVSLHQPRMLEFILIYKIFENFFINIHQVFSWLGVLPSLLQLPGSKIKNKNDEEQNFIDFLDLYLASTHELNQISLTKKRTKLQLQNFPEKNLNTFNILNILENPNLVNTTEESFSKMFDNETVRQQIFSKVKGKILKTIGVELTGFDKKNIQKIIDELNLNLHIHTDKIHIIAKEYNRLLDPTLFSISTLKGMVTLSPSYEKNLTKQFKFWYTSILNISDKIDILKKFLADIKNKPEMAHNSRFLILMACIQNKSVVMPPKINAEIFNKNTFKSFEEKIEFLADLEKIYKEEEEKEEVKEKPSQELKKEKRTPNCTEIDSNLEKKLVSETKTQDTYLKEKIPSTPENFKVETVPPQNTSIQTHYPERAIEFKENQAKASDLKLDEMLIKIVNDPYQLLELLVKNKENRENILEPLQNLIRMKSQEIKSRDFVKDVHKILHTICENCSAKLEFHKGKGSHHAFKIEFHQNDPKRTFAFGYSSHGDNNSINFQAKNDFIKMLYEMAQYFLSSTPEKEEDK